MADLLHLEHACHLLAASQQEATMHVEELDLDVECDQTWDDLKVDESPLGHCERCERAVVNLSMLTEEQARELLNGDDPPCALAVFHESTGRIAFADSEQLSAQRSGLSRLLAAGAVSLTLMSGLQTWSESPPTEHLAAEQFETALASPAKTVSAVSPLGELFDLQTEPNETESAREVDAEPKPAFEEPAADPPNDEYGRTVGY